MEIEFFKIRKVLKFNVLLLAMVCATVIISVLLSIFIGVYVLSDTFAGNDYFGMIIYYFRCSIPIVLIAPYIIIPQLKVNNDLKFIYASIFSGVLFYLLSSTLIDWYLDNMDHFPMRDHFVLLVRYDIGRSSIAFLSILLAINMFLAGRFSRRKNEYTKT